MVIRIREARMVEGATIAGRVTLTFAAGVADVRLNRPDKMNALDNAMFEALVEAGETAEGREGLRAVVLSARAAPSAPGSTWAIFGRMAEGPRRALGREPGAAPTGSAHAPTAIANRAQYACWVWRELPVPVIAAVHGVAFGGGFQVALGADMRYVAPDARMSVMEIKWGLVPDMAGTQLMRHLVREDIVRELTYTGRIFSGEEALRTVSPPASQPIRGRGAATAREIAGKSPDAIRAASASSTPRPTSTRPRSCWPSCASRRRSLARRTRSRRFAPGSSGARRSLWIRSSQLRGSPPATVLMVRRRRASLDAFADSPPPSLRGAEKRATVGALPSCRKAAREGDHASMAVGARFRAA